MRVLVPLLGVLALVAFALWLRPARERAAGRLAVAREHMPPPNVERLPELALPPALTEEPGEGPEDAQRESIAARTESVAGRVELPRDLPPREWPRVVAHAQRPAASRPRSARIETTVARDGSFALRLPEETLSVRLELVGRLFTLTEAVEVPPGTLDVVLRPTVFAALQGRVHRPAGFDAETREEPIHVSTRLSASYAGPDGAFELVVEPDRPLEVVASSEVHLTGLAAPTRLEGRQEVAALRPGEVGWVELTLEPWGTVRGFVTDQSGAPLEGATVELVLATEPLFKHLRIAPGRAGADGGFVIGPLRPGASELLARAPGYRSERRTILLAEDGHLLLHFALAPRAIVHGRVLGPDGSAYAGAGVEVLGSNPRFSQSDRADAPLVETDGEGRFSVSAEEDLLRLVATAAGFARSAELTLELRPGEERTDVVLWLRPACSLVGIALDENRKPVNGVLTFRSEDGTRRFLFADAQGRIEEHGLPPGRARIESGELEYENGLRVPAEFVGAADVELTPEHETRVELILVRSKDG